MQQKRKPMNMMVFVILLIGVFIAYILFTTLFRGCQETGPTLPEMKTEELKPFQEYLTDNSKAPQEYILDLFQEHDIVFLGTMTLLEVLQPKQQVDLLIDLIPRLYERGVRNIAILNMLAEDQEKIDALLAAQDFDEQAVKKLLFNRLVIGGYEEYVHIFRTAWTVNNKRSLSSDPLRIIALSPRINYENMEQVVDLDAPEDPELYRKIYGNRILDDVMLEIIEREIAERNEKAVIFIPQAHCVIHLLNEAVAKQYDSRGMEYMGSVAYRLYARIGDRCVSVFLHSPWLSYKDKSLFPEFPAGGIIDLLLTKVSQEYKHRGFSVKNGPFSEIAIDKAYQFNIRYPLANQEGMLLKDLCDGYVILGPLSLYQSVTLIPDFINESNFEEALARVPWPRSQNEEEGEEITLEEFNRNLKVFPQMFNQIMMSFGE
jgi:hypothetical protein